MSLASQLKASKVGAGDPFTPLPGADPGETYLQYMVRNNGGKIPTNAGALLHGVYSYGSDLPYDQLLQAQRQNANLRRRGEQGGRWEGGRWLDRAGNPIQPGGNHFNYGVLPGAPAAAAPQGTKELLPDSAIPRGTPPPTGTTPTLPPVGSRPRVPVEPPPPPTTLPTTVPGGQAPHTGPYMGDGNNAPPGAATLGPRPSFDPTQLLLALRQSTQNGALRGANPVQGNLASWLAQSMKMPAAPAQPTRQAPR